MFRITSLFIWRKTTSTWSRCQCLPPRTYVTGVNAYPVLIYRRMRILRCPSRPASKLKAKQVRNEEFYQLDTKGLEGIRIFWIPSPTFPNIKEPTLVQIGIASLPSLSFSISLRTSRPLTRASTKTRTMTSPYAVGTTSDTSTITTRTLPSIVPSAPTITHMASTTTKCRRTMRTTLLTPIPKVSIA